MHGISNRQTTLANQHVCKVLTDRPSAVAEEARDWRVVGKVRLGWGGGMHVWLAGYVHHHSVRKKGNVVVISLCVCRLERAYEFL